VRRATFAHAALAQSAEHLTRNEKVKGSIPLGGSISTTRPLPWKTQVSGFFLLSSAWLIMLLRFDRQATE